MKISNINIESLGCLNNFNIYFDEYKENEYNLFVLTGQNGSGKSTFLDALYSIAKSKNISEISGVKFDIYSDKNKIMWGNLKNTTQNTEIQNPWDMVIRYYTGNSERQLCLSDEYQSNLYLSLNRENLKWVLAACFLSGVWFSDDNKIIRDKLDSILFYGKNTFEPILVTLKLANYDKSILEKLPKASNPGTINNIIEWDLTSKDILGSTFDVTATLNTLLNNKDKIQELHFIYKKSNCTEPLPDETLSDGELGLIRRASILTYLREIKDKKCLVLLDEPETHFNENWKRHFVYLIRKSLEHTKHDVFLASHSSILVTDVKSKELYHFKNICGNSQVNSVEFKTYGSSIIDIGRILFNLEADIGESSKEDIEATIKSNNIGDLEKLLLQVGPGEWRWKIRSKINQLEKADMCCNFKIKDPELENEK